MRVKNAMFAIKIGRRPKRSASRPNTNAPIGRVIKLAVMVNAISEIGRWNSLAIAETQNTRTKKSKASTVHPRKPEATAFLVLRSSAMLVAVVISRKLDYTGKGQDTSFIAEPFGAGSVKSRETACGCILWLSGPHQG